MFCRPSEDWNSTRCCILSDCYVPRVFLIIESMFFPFILLPCLSFQTQKIVFCMNGPWCFFIFFEASITWNTWQRVKTSVFTFSLFSSAEERSWSIWKDMQVNKCNYSAALNVHFIHTVSSPKDMFIKAFVLFMWLSVFSLLRILWDGIQMFLSGVRCCY